MSTAAPISAFCTATARASRRTTFARQGYFNKAVTWVLLRGAVSLGLCTYAALTLWLKGDYESTWSEQFCGLFDAVFTDRHLSLRCFLRSSIASIISVFLLYVLFAEIGGDALKDRFAEEFQSVSLWQALLLGAVINIIPDYLSLYETRWLLHRLEKITSLWGQ